MGFVTTSMYQIHFHPHADILLCSFAAYLGDQGLSSQTIRSSLVGVRNMQTSLGLLDSRDQSSLSILHRVQARIKHANLGNGTAMVKLPVTPHLQRQMQQHLEATRHNERVVIWAVCCMAFFGCFRRGGRQGELLLESSAGFDQHRHLVWRDVAIDSQANPWIFCIHLKQSKTDQFGRGARCHSGKNKHRSLPTHCSVGL